MIRVQAVVVTIVIETNKGPQDVELTQQVDEDDADFTTRIGLALTGLKEAAT